VAEQRRGLLRLTGLDRRGPLPAQTRKGAPLRPWTIPNLVGYARLALIALFLWLSFSSGDGRTFAAFAVFSIAAIGDYLDGLVARVTGQYSRLGSLLDPLVDRLLVISGVVVCWHFELVPRWALAALIARELLMLAIVAFGLRRGLDIEINAVGRAAVWLVMAGVALALVSDAWLVRGLLYTGLVGTWAATVLYVRDGLGRLRMQR
jgi:CDP-diacylglycerol--glycerol-3-phosphate 3-phosphatidyltransferase